MTDEYIKREAAIAVLEEKQKELCPIGKYSRNAVYGSDREKFDELQEIIDAIESITAVDVVSRDCYDRLLVENDELRKERPAQCGKWLPVGVDDMDEDAYRCSECGVEQFFLGSLVDNFCPNCGASMKDDDGE